ncbi:ALBINO3-like protein 3, mitochondrial [Dendrobium catenatum]|uniref:ALBINO3-like protein 3, mitochondrial n=1 Tax=Dendrobium catenatum TaxID=906689 RepID=A0A2I0WRA4_9ASPA|nr:ALBINO3-like protein 3, mitochondrial [Dendrobium catenatum]
MEPVKNRVATENDHNSAADSEVLIPIEAVPPKKLLEDMAAGDQDKALILLRTTIEKDPELVQALVAIGQILCSKKLFEEAAENFELAIHKLSYIKEEEIGLLLLSLFGAGVSRIWEGKNSDGIEHLKKIAELREPDSPMDKACYYRGTLFQLGEKSEAAKYLRIAATYDPGNSINKPHFLLKRERKAREKKEEKEESSSRLAPPRPPPNHQGTSEFCRTTVEVLPHHRRTTKGRRGSAAPRRSSLAPPPDHQGKLGFCRTTVEVLPHHCQTTKGHWGSVAPPLDHQGTSGFCRTTVGVIPHHQGTPEL